MDRTATVGIEDVAGVRSRVSWDAVIGGAAVALSVYFLLTVFFAGVGLSLTELGVRTGAATTIALVAGVLSVVLAMYCGGCTTSVLTAGETRREAMIHGLLTWAVVTAVAIGMVGMGLRGGYNAVLGAALVAGNTDAAADWEDAARRAGISQERINQLKAQATPENARAQAQNPENVEAARRGAMIAAWVTLAGTLLSIGAAVLGAMSSAGPTLGLFPAATVVAERRTTIIPQT
jgi:hypothetical protein